MAEDADGLQSGGDAGSATAAAGPVVLIVDDDPQVPHLVGRALERDGYRTLTLADGAAVVPTVGARRVALVILDLGLPGMHGLDVLTELRRVTDVPVIILSGRGEETDRVLGLQLGADDYMVKPFSPRELVARVGSVLRRTSPGAAAGRRFEFEGLVVDTAARQVTVGGEVVETTSREFDVLAYLVASPGRVVSRDELLRRVWHSSSEWQQESTVTEHVRRLRQKIEADPDEPRFIRTVRGVGYRFTAGRSAPAGG
jgi:two-component system phosphate regulon response regulator PhoB